MLDGKTSKAWLLDISGGEKKIELWRVDADDNDNDLVQTCYIDLEEKVELHMFGSHVA